MKKIIFSCLAAFSFLCAEDPPSPKIQNNELIPMQTDQFTASFKKMLWILLGLIILAIVTVWVLKKLTKIRHDQFNKFNQIKIIEKRILSPKSNLYVVEIAKKRVLIAESQIEVRKLETLPHLTELDEG